MFGIRDSNGELTPSCSNLVCINGKVMGFEDLQQELGLSPGVSLESHREESVLTS